MPANKALKVLPPELPQEYRDFVACTRDTLEVPPGPLTWARIPGVPDSLKPTATFGRGEGGAVKVTISAAGLALDVEISVTKRGNLKADTSKWPTDTPFIGDQLKDLAKGVDTWVNDLNADFRKNNKKLGSISVKDGKLIGGKVALDPRTTMAETPTSVQSSSDVANGSAGVSSDHRMDWVLREETNRWRTAPRTVAPRRNLWWGADEVRRGPLVGAGAGVFLTVASGAFILFGGQPSGTGTLTLPPVGDPVTITGTLATTDLDFEVLNDVSSELTMTFPDTGGLVEGSAQIVYDARSSSGATFTNTSELDEWYGYYDAERQRFVGAVRHQATGEAGGQAQSRELSPLFLDLIYDAATRSLSGGLQGVGFSYPVTGTTTGQVSSADPGNTSLGGTFDASALDRTDTTETVLENSWRLFVNGENTISGVGVLRANQVFDGDAFGAGCTFEAIRVARMSGKFDPASGAVTGTAKVLAWGSKSESCTFETGVAAEDAAVTGNLATASGELELVINASETVAGPFSVNGSFDSADFAAPGQAGAGDMTLPIAGVAVGIGLTLGSIGLGLFMKRPEHGAPSPT